MMREQCSDEFKHHHLQMEEEVTICGPGTCAALQGGTGTSRGPYYIGAAAMDVLPGTGSSFD